MLYMKNKDSEMEIAKSSAKEKHIRKINSIYSSEIDIYNKMHPICYDLIQEYFILSRGRNEVDFMMQEKLQNLVKLVLGQRSVKFEISDEVDSIEPEADNLSLHLGDSDYSSNNENVYVLGAKRSKPRSFEYDAEKIIKEKKLNDGGLSSTSSGLGTDLLSSTHFLSTNKIFENDTHSLDSTFQIPNSKTMERNVLGEKNVNVQSSVVAVDKKCMLIWLQIVILKF